MSLKTIRVASSARQRVLALAAAAGLTLFAAACSSDKDTPNAGPTTGGAVTTDDGEDGGTPDPCTLLTLAEVSAQLGEEFTISHELAPGGLPGQRTCSYEKSADTMDTVSVAVWPFDPAEVDSFILQVGEVNQYDGLGDRAFGEKSSLWIQDGNIMINITFTFIEVDNQDPINQLGLLADSRL